MVALHHPFLMSSSTSIPGRKRSSTGVDESDEDDVTIDVRRALRSSSDRRWNPSESVFHVETDKDVASWRNYTMLILLCMTDYICRPLDDRFLDFCQGIPMGLVFGTIPFLVKGLELGSTSSYADLGYFSLATYPYNLKLLWSPIVDSLYIARFGRRKTWIVPLVALTGLMFVYVGYVLPPMMTATELPVHYITALFGVLVAVCATLEIAVDGWALTLLDRNHVQFSSTCQTVGLNAGYFTSFTLFLALASPEFCNKYLRKISAQSDKGILELGPFLRVVGVFFLVCTLIVMKLKPENKEIASKNGGLTKAYQHMLKIAFLPNVRLISAMLLLGKIGFTANDTLMPLKLLDKGFPKESLAVTILIDFACQLCLSWIVPRWTRTESPLRPWQIGVVFKTGTSLFGMWMVRSFPSDGLTRAYYFLIVLYTVLSSFASTIMLVSLNAFFSTICDPSVGGTYMTYLGTFSNLGSMIPRLLALSTVDSFTSRLCHLDPMMASNISGPFDDRCGSEEAASTCHKLGGECRIVSDGYYTINCLSFLVGLLIMHIVIRPVVWRLQSAPSSTWRIN